MFNELLHNDATIMIFAVSSTLFLLFAITVASMLKESKTNKRLAKVVKDIETDFLIKDSLPPPAPKPLSEDEQFEHSFAKTFNM